MSRLATTLTVPDTHTTLTDRTQIAEYLHQRGIAFEQWQAAEPFTPDADETVILNTYRHTLQPFMAAGGYQTADVVSVTEATPNLPDIRAKFLKEHTHTEDEVRFFVEGQGHFWFHLNEEEPVFCVTCTAGDLLAVPANVRHWFDLGTPAHVKVIRIFTDAGGWVPHYTGSGIDTRYQPMLQS